MLGKCDRDGPVGASGNIGAGAIDRIDDPRKRDGTVGHGSASDSSDFQPASRTSSEQTLVQELVHRNVCFGHRRVVGPLVQRLNGPRAIARREIASRAHYGCERFS